MFVKCYLEHQNAHKATIEAGYSAKSAEIQASRLLKNVGVRKRVLSARKRAQEETEINAAWLLNRLGELAEVDIAEMFQENGAIKPIDEVPLACRRLVSGLEVTHLYEGQGSQKVAVGYISKVRLGDRVKVLELIGRHIGVAAWQSQTQVNIPLVIFRNYTGLGEAEVEQRVNRLLEEAASGDSPA